MFQLTILSSLLMRDTFLLQVALFMLLVMYCVHAQREPYSPLRSLGRYSTGGPTAANVYLAKPWNSQGNQSLIYTSPANALFPGTSSFPPHAMYVIANFNGSALVSQGAVSLPRPQLITTSLPWVNDVVYLPPNSLGLTLPFRSLLTVNGRFPTGPRFGRSPSVGGTISIINIDSIPNTSVFDITGGDSGACEWYYNQVQLMDINEDGLLDVLTARFRDEGACPPTVQIPPYNFVSEFIAYLQPSSSPLVPWTFVRLFDFENATNRGPTGFFQFLDLDNALYGNNEHPAFELLSSEFFGTGALAIYHLTGTVTSWLQQDKTVARVVVEQGLGGMYDAKVAELNRQKPAEIVATNHITLGSNGIYAFSTVGNFRSGGWIRRALATNFSVVGRPSNNSARLRPGEFKVYYPRPNNVPGNSLKPLIALGTDGGGQLVLLTPKTQKKDSYEYEKVVLDEQTEANTGCDIIGPLTEDLNNDGYLELLAPCLSGGFISVFTHGPSA